MPLTSVFCIIGAASISAFPLFSGFISKSMVLAAAIQEGHPVVWLALLFASAGVFHHSGIKIPYFAFFAHDSGIRVKEAPTNMLVAMFLAAFVCIFLGVYPWPLYAILPYPVDFDPYTVAHVLTQSQLLFFSALAFVFLQLTKLYPPELPGVNIDSEWLYRRFVPRSVHSAIATFSPLDRRLRVVVRQTVVGGVFTNMFRYHGPEGIFARTLSTGSSTLWLAVLFVVLLAISYWS